MFSLEAIAAVNGARVDKVDPRRGVGIRIEGLSKSFRLAQGSELKVFSGLDIDIGPGSFTAILGPSGCGKSTLLRLIASLESADAGQIVFGDGMARHKPRI